MKLAQNVNVLLLGSGGREHAFAHCIARSPRTANLYIAPGNAGTALEGTNVDLSPNDFGTVKQFVLRNNINLVVVGPEDPLVNGVVDFFHSDSEIYHIPVIGPSGEGARLEGSKEYAKAFMMRHNVPTAAYRSFGKGEVEQAVEFLSTLRPPYVLKADGLAAGKGVVILNELEEARRELEQMFDGKFGKAGARVVIEEYLSGIECSVFVATDGKNYKILPVAKDYKRIGEGDTGLNTGGMGAVSPVPFADEEFMRKVEERIVRPTVAGLEADKIDYHGFVFIGLMNCGGDPYVIEYNVRMGDPETEVVLPRIESDIMELFEGIAFGQLDECDLRIDPRTAVTVVCVSGGYPEAYEKGKQITGLELPTPEGTKVYHAGTAAKAGETLTSGGRVLAVTSLAEDIPSALAKSYGTIEQINYEGKYCRRDIGQDVMRYTKE